MRELLWVRRLTSDVARGLMLPHCGTCLGFWHCFQMHAMCDGRGDQISLNPKFVINNHRVTDEIVSGVKHILVTRTKEDFVGLRSEDSQFSLTCCLGRKEAIKVAHSLMAAPTRGTCWWLTICQCCFALLGQLPQSVPLLQCWNHCWSQIGSLRLRCNRICPGSLHHCCLQMGCATWWPF